MLVLAAITPELVTMRYGASALSVIIPGGRYIDSSVAILYMLAIALSCGWLLHSLTFLSPQMSASRTHRTSQLGIWLPYAIAWALGALFGASQGAATYAWVSLFMAAGVAATSVLSGRQGMTAAALAMSRFLVVASLLAGLLMPARAYAPYSVWPGGWWTGVDRLQGVLPHPNTLGWVAALAIALELFAAKRTRWVFVPLGLLALAQCGSRTAALALVAGLIAALLLWLSQRGTLAPALTLLLGGALGSVAILFALLEGFSLESFNGRLETWKAALTVFSEHPVLGSGPGAYLLAESGSPATGYAHNQVFQTLSELGLIGLAALTIHIIALIRFVRRKSDPYFGLVLVVMWCTMFLSENILRFASTNFVLQIILFQFALYASVEMRRMERRAPP